jgi:hypothetical protein
MQSKLLRILKVWLKMKIFSLKLSHPKESNLKSKRELSQSLQTINLGKSSPQERPTEMDF